MKHLIFTFLLIVLSKNVFGQAREFRRQRAQLMVFNIGFNGLIGGIGSMIHSDGSTTKFQAFTKGFYRGAIGGTACHVGLSLTYQINKQQNIAYAWPARLVNSFGTSVVQNVAEGRRMFERMHFNLFLTRLDYYPYQKKFEARLFPSSIIGVAAISRRAKLNVPKSLASGILHFESSVGFNSLVYPNARGIAWSTSIGVQTGLERRDYHSVVAHETAHVLQFDRAVYANGLLYSFDKKLKARYKFYSKISKYLYFDLNSGLMYLGYINPRISHNCIFTEQEAENYSHRVAYLCN